jgi:hypothetical protein
MPAEFLWRQPRLWDACRGVLAMTEGDECVVPEVDDQRGCRYSPEIELAALEPMRRVVEVASLAHAHRQDHPEDAQGALIFLPGQALLCIA